MAHSMRTVTIGSRVGLHARPASLFVQAATASGHRVILRNAAGATADAMSILSVLALGVHFGEQVDIEVDGDDAELVARQLADLLESNLD